MIRRILKETRYIWAVFKVNLHMWGVYRLKLVVWIVSGIVEPIVWSVLWFAAASESQQMEMTGPEILTYYLFIALVSRLTRSWTFDSLRKEIISGRYSKYLLWPSGVAGFRFGSDWANKLVTISALLPFWVVWLYVLVVNDLFVLDLMNFPLFILALLVGTFIRFYMDMILAHVALWTERVDGLAIVYYSLSRLLGGVTVPLMLLPVWIGSVIELLPFRYLYSFPVEVFQGTVEGWEITYGFGIALAWLLLEIAVLQGILHVGLKRYEAPGI